MSAFHEILFPPAISYGSSGGPKFKTTLFPTDAGYEQRNIDWSAVRHEFDVSHSMREFDGTLNLPGIRDLHAFFLARGGRSHGFRFKDWNDHMLIDQNIGVGDGVTTVFPIFKTYTNVQAENGASYSYIRRILKIDWTADFVLRVDGVTVAEFDYEVDVETGVVTFNAAPAVDAVVTVGEAEFHVPVRFDTDHCDVTVEFWNGGSWPSIPLVELRQQDTYQMRSISTDEVIHDVLFPPSVSFGASGGPKFKTAVFGVDSGYEANVRDWTRMRGEWEVAQGVRTPAQMEEITSFFMNRRGMAYGFRFKDWSDYRLKQEVIATGDEVETEFQVTKTYTSKRVGGDTFTYVRPITKLAWGTIAGVTVGGVVAVKCSSDLFTEAGLGLGYIVDEATGVLTFKDPPAGPRYAGDTPVTDITYEAGTFPATTSTRSAAMVDFDSGLAFLRGANGIRRVDIATADEIAGFTNAAMAFPQTDPTYDNQTVTSIVAVGPDDSFFVTVGGANTQVLYKVHQSTGVILDSYGTAAGSTPVEGAISVANAPGCVSNDGSMLIHLGQTGNHWTILSADTLDLIGVTDRNGESPPAATASCPLYEANFAILTNPAAGLELWDDSGNKLLTIADGVGDWIAWDGGSAEGVLIGWHSPEGAFISKYAVDSQTIVWKRKIPAGCMVSGQSRLLEDRLCFKADDRVYHLDTVAGTLSSRTIAADFGEIVAYDSVTDTLLSIPQTSFVSGVADTDVAAVALTPAEEVKIGLCEFHVPVRFDTDYLDVTQDFWEVSSWPSIPLVEVRDWSEIEF